MPVSSKETRNRTHLRAEADFRLKIGIASGDQWSLGVDTLASLFRLASSPDTMADGIKMLHELQTHQVELEMQHQELERSAQLHNDQLIHLKMLFEHAPFGYLVVQANGIISDSNLAAAKLLGVKGKACNGRPFESFCTSLSAYGLQDLLKHLSNSSPPQVCVLELKPAEGRPKRIQLLITRSPDTGDFLFGLSSYDQLLKL